MDALGIHVMLIICPLKSCDRFPMCHYSIAKTPLFTWHWRLSYKLFVKQLRIIEWKIEYFACAVYTGLNNWKTLEYC